MVQTNYNTSDFKRSRSAYMSQCAIEHVLTLLAADAFLAKLLTSLGFSDVLTGIVSSFISVSFIFQLASIFLVRTKAGAKKTVIFFDVLCQVFFMLIYFIPFIPMDESIKKALVIILILAGFAGKSLIISIYFKWANSFVHPAKRATFSAVKEMVSLVIGIIVSIVLGYIIDQYESIGNLNGGFLFIAISMLIMNICNFICLMMIKKESVEENEANSKPWGDVVKNTFGNKNFRSITIFTVIQQCSVYFTVGFLGVFKTNDLLLTVSAIQLINMIASGARVVVSIPFGKFSDKYSFAKGIELALGILVLAYLCLVFTTKETWFLIVIFTILQNAAYAGTEQNAYNIVYSYIKEDYITQAMAIKNCVGGIFGFAASLAGGKVLAFIQGNGNRFLGIPMYGQQLLGLISLVLTVVAILYIHFIIGKQKTLD